MDFYKQNSAEKQTEKQRPSSSKSNDSARIIFAAFIITSSAMAIAFSTQSLPIIG